ncbi:MAG: group II intron reverse transcriptase/maturase [Firmicutes bacterium]|nr:group II intron reverse transcriptase/maturase [Bacillota bacterium]
MNPEGEKKVHSLIDKVYAPKNLRLAWERVEANRGSGGIDRVTLGEFKERLEEELHLLGEALRAGTYEPSPVRRVYIPKPGQPTKRRPLGIPTIRDRVVQQAVLNRLAPIFEPDMDDANFGYRAGRSTKDALGKVWREIQQGNEWIVDADLTDFFGTVDHEKLLFLVARRVSDGRVLSLIRQFLAAGYMEEGKYHPTEQGTPQGGVISPLLSNVLLTPFDREMRHRGYNLTRYADDWVVTCRSRRQAEKALKTATEILRTLGVALNPTKTRIVHIRQGFEFLGFKIKQGSSPLRLKPDKIVTSARSYSLYAYPSEKSLQRFKENVRALTRRKAPGNERQLIEQLNPLLRGWGEYYKKAHVRRLFNRLDRWIIRRLWSHRHKRWRNSGWKTLPASKLYGEYGLVNLVSLIPSIRSSRMRTSS